MAAAAVVHRLGVISATRSPRLRGASPVGKLTVRSAVSSSVQQADLVLREGMLMSLRRSSSTIDRFSSPAAAPYSATATQGLMDICTAESANAPI